MKCKFLTGRAALLRGLGFWRRGSAALPLLAAMVLFFAVGATAQTNALSDAEIQGRQLAQQLCDARPETNFNQTGILKIRNSTTTTNLSIYIATEITTDGWKNVYTASSTNDCDLSEETISVSHGIGQPIVFQISGKKGVQAGIWVSMAYRKKKTLTGEQVLSPFANSDFWLCDLGLEFFHWPQQKVLPKTANLKRGRDYTLLESTNPNPSTNGYSRVLSWIDRETGGILEAEAYDASGKLLKVFEPKSFKKVNGQWELQEMEIRNVQTGSRSRLEFDLKQN